MDECKKALFLDRDGVIIKDSHLLTDIKDVEVLKGVPEAISKIRELGFMTILVTNQTVVSRGLLSLDDTYKLNGLILDKLKVENSNALIDDVFLCPHHPKATVLEYKIDCECRKPKPGMLLSAAKKYNIDLSKSFMVGDRVSDIIAGNRAGCKTIQLLTGEENSKIIESSLEFSESDQLPNFKVKSLVEAISFC